MLSSSFSECSTILIFVLLCCFLAVGALFDAHGAFVPDDATIPYAALGIMSAAINRMWVTFFVGCFFFIYAVRGVEPMWLKDLGKKLLLRSYKAEETINNVLEEQSSESNEFELKYGKKLHWLLLILSVAMFLVPAAIIFTTSFSKVSITIFLAILILCIFSFLSVYDSRFSHSEEYEEMSAFGGADVLILVGMFGFYGAFAFPFVLVPTFCVYIIYYIISHYAHGDQLWGGKPMLPVMFFTIPIRVYLVCGPLSGVISEISSAFSDWGFILSQIKNILPL